MIQQTYIINRNTCALIPAKEIDYSTIVIEHEKTIYVTETPLEIMEASCLQYWASYEGRREAVIQKLNYKQKTPIPVCTENKLCFFPTHSPTHMDNCWINFVQVATWEKITKKDQGHNNQIEILFKNWHRLKLDVSAHTLQQQMDRTFTVMYESGMVLR